MGNLTNDVSSSFPTPPPNAASMNPQAMASLQQAQALARGPFGQAYNFAVMTGVNASISCVMKRIRGKEDVQSRDTATFDNRVQIGLWPKYQNSGISRVVRSNMGKDRVQI
ncbi:chloroplastic import inner membrane translocase subunit HP30-2-like isoform X1 [Camellia sinensis]|uniref:chloroplastic import inner membrane translocase subunit HP30-2-like isoform X1 n=1 Tax=Camellia sinensis TaxID=4442 RepID=UPI00103628A9|nr:chloroplastic import inner membrane translocase subunit HP30-2-like isoform X1 [Camellia sinensis]